jgi:hypothetical protein
MLIAPNSGIVPPLAPLVGRRSAEPPSPGIQHRVQRLFHRSRTSAPDGLGSGRHRSGSHDPSRSLHPLLARSAQKKPKIPNVRKIL